VRGSRRIVVSTSSATGPTLAAAILSVASWPWLFAVNVPVGIATLAL
jgi:MFS transporter, DHA2 family, multidrug resistance protein